jgi:pimeloyl-ACP methyl ester carboxylesterase
MPKATQMRSVASSSGPDYEPSAGRWTIPADAVTTIVNGYPMTHVRRGAGQPVVLVHGSLSDYRYWTPQLTSPLPGFQLIAVSLRHFYPEPWNGDGDDFSIETQAEDLGAFIECLGVGAVHLVGWSRGGSVALGAAKTRPDLVKRLVLMEPVISSLLPQPSATGKPDPNRMRLEAVAAHYAKGDIEGGLQYFVDDINGLGTWMRRTDEQRQLARDNAWTLVRQITDTDAVTRDDLRKMRMPVLLVGGERGPPFLAQTMDAAQTYLPSAARVTISNAGHLMNRDNPTEFNQALLAFLSA